MDMTMWEDDIIWLESLLWMGHVLFWREKCLKTVIAFHVSSKETCSEQKRS